MATPQIKDLPVQHFLNKIPKSIVEQKGFAVTAHDLPTAKAFARRKGVLGEVLLTRVSDSQATMYFESDILLEIALDMKYQYDAEQLKIWERENSMFYKIKCYLGLKTA